nr:AMP-binding protein [Moraxella osloensis]
MSYFWNNLNSQQLALISSDKKNYSFLDIQSNVDLVKRNILNNFRQLIFLEMEVNELAIFVYLACLQTRQPVFLLNPSLPNEQKKTLYETYLPNLIISSSQNNLEFKPYFNGQHILDNDLALLLSTSGTTGDPKLVKLSFDNLQSNADSICEYLNLTTRDRAILSLPLYYSYGLSILNSHLNSKSSVVISNYSMMQKEFWSLINEFNVTSLAGVPYTYEILHKLRFARMDLPSIRYMTQAGGKLNNKYVTDFANLAEEKQFLFYIMYGQTEATARISYLEPSKVLLKPDSIGKSIPQGKLNLIDESGSIITDPYQNGELVYQGPNVMIGYAEKLLDLSQSESTGLLLTGDIAYFDAEGDYFIVGRKKRFIKLFGNRINLDQVEFLVSQHGYKCYCSGTDEVLWVAISDSFKDSVDDVKSLICESLGIHSKYVKIILIDDEIPLLPSGKINYKEIFKSGQFK